MDDNDNDLSLKDFPEPPEFLPVIDQIEEVDKEWDGQENIEEKVLKYQAVKSLRLQQVVDDALHNLCHTYDGKWYLTHGRLTDKRSNVVRDLKELGKLSCELGAKAVDHAMRYAMLRKQREAEENEFALRVQNQAEASAKSPTLKRLEDMREQAGG